MLMFTFCSKDDDNKPENNMVVNDTTKKEEPKTEKKMSDLNLDPQKCPLLAGETLRQEYGGICWGHNAVIAKLPSVIPNSYVISSEGCMGNAQKDGFHFCAEGYRIIGERYADKMLSLLGK